MPTPNWRCEGNCVRSQASELLALICELRGPFCCKPSSVVETPKTNSRNSIDVQMDVVWMSRLVVVKESNSVPVGGRLSHRRISVQLELPREIEVESHGTEEAIDSGWEVKFRPWGMMRKAKLRWPRRDRSWGLVQHGAQRKLEIRRLIRLSFPTRSSKEMDGCVESPGWKPSSSPETTFSEVGCAGMRAGVAPAVWVNMEEAALGHGASSTVEVANWMMSLVHDGPVFLIYAVGYRKDNGRGRWYLFWRYGCWWSCLPQARERLKLSFSFGAAQFG